MMAKMTSCEQRRVHPKVRVLSNKSGQINLAGAKKEKKKRRQVHLFLEGYFSLAIKSFSLILVFGSTTQFILSSSLS